VIDIATFAVQRLISRRQVDVDFQYIFQLTEGIDLDLLTLEFDFHRDITSVDEDNNRDFLVFVNDYFVNIDELNSQQN
jgi:hypothetical protein